MTPLAKRTEDERYANEKAEIVAKARRGRWQYSQTQVALKQAEKDHKARVKELEAAYVKQLREQSSKANLTSTDSGVRVRANAALMELHSRKSRWI